MKLAILILTLSLLVGCASTKVAQERKDGYAHLTGISFRASVTPVRVIVYKTNFGDITIEER